MAAKTKRKAARAKPPPMTWIVLANGAEIEVEAYTMDITDYGVLVFMGEDGQCTMAYASTAWSTVHLVYVGDPEPPEPDQG